MMPRLPDGQIDVRAIRWDTVTDVELKEYFLWKELFLKQLNDNPNAPYGKNMDYRLFLGRDNEH